MSKAPIRITPWLFGSGTQQAFVPPPNQPDPPPPTDTMRLTAENGDFILTEGGDNIAYDEAA